MTFKTEQEKFWAGEFGTEYIDRNKGDALLASNLDFFVKGLHQARGIKNLKNLMSLSIKRRKTRKVVMIALSRYLVERIVLIKF